ncbi:MAG: TIGR04282 family arsenosugar biosynthesis glycosyltransferase [Burkholderiales bacterium]
MKASVLVFAKAPVPGAVKTRLIPLIGADGAARLQRQLTEHSLRIARDARIGPVELCCTPNREHAFFAECAVRYRMQLSDQTGCDLGERMHNALAQACSEGRSAILIGSDCPSLTATDLGDAAAALASGYRAVFVPSTDGGYMLVGTTASDRRLFERIDWGSATVMAQTRERLHSLGWLWQELPERWDVDRPEDYERMLREGLLEVDARQ